jgi:hypothetical protein
VWERLFEFMRQYFNLAEKQRRQEDEIHELQRQLRDLSQTNAEENRALRSLVERLVIELRHSQEREEAERKILKLELENHLLRQERGLPPAKTEKPKKADDDNQDEDVVDEK